MRSHLAALLFIGGLVACGDNLHTNGVPDAGVDASPDGNALPVGPEIAVDDPVAGNAGLNGLQPYVAFNGTQYLAVWADNRASTSADIFAARINPDGSIADANGIAVNTAVGKQITPTAAWVGDRWLVAWSNVGDIGAATIDGTTGAVTQLPAVAATAASETLPAIAAHGTTALIAWQSGLDIQAAQYSAGTVGSPFAIAATAADEVDPAVAASATGFIVVWTEAGAHIRGQLVASGAVSGSSFDVTTAAGTQAEPAATFDGTDYIITYDNGSDVYGTRVTAAGAILDAAGVAIGTGTGTQSTSSVSCDAASCFVAFSDSRTFATTGFDIYGQQVAFDLTLQGSNVAISVGNRYEVSPGIAGGTSGWIAAWEDNRTGGTTLIFGSRITNAGAVVDTNGFVIDTNRNAELDPAVFTASPTSELVMWADSRAVGNDIKAVRFAGISGMRLDNTALAESSAIGEQSTPVLTYDGTQYLAAWADVRNVTLDIFATRIDANGNALDTNSIPVSTAAGIQASPDVATGGGNSLIVWQDRRNGDFDIYGALVTPAGTVSVSDIMISTATNDQNSPAVAFDSTDNVFVVVWSDNRSGTADIYAARVSTAGAVLDASGVRVTNDGAAHVRPDVAVSGSVIMAVWDDRRVDATGDIYGARLSAANTLTVLDASGIVISAAANQQTSPTITGLPNSNFAVAWTDARDTTTNGFDVYGARLDSTGHPDSATGFAISNQPGNETVPSFQASSLGASTTIVYQAYRPDVGTTRVFKRAVNFP